jgi:hypothetical protein
MVEYYYSINNTKFGPYSLEELVQQNLAPETLIWHNQLPQWVKLSEIPELQKTLLIKTPPPIPDKNEKDAPTFAAVTSVPASTPPSAFVLTVKRYRWVIAWCIFHLSALFLSYSEIKIFNDTGEPKTEKFWPFVKFTFPYFIPDDNATYVKFNGIFTQYDWTEFSFYVGIVLFFIILMHVYRKSS